MKLLKISYLLVLFAGLELSWAQPVDFVFQNGLNDYEGCEDSYVSQDGISNNGNSETLVAKYEKCSS